MLQRLLKQGCEWNGIHSSHDLQQGSISFKDISEGVAGQVAEVRVAHQALHQRLLERLSGRNPQLLLADPFGRALSADLFTCRPVTGRKHSEVSAHRWSSPACFLSECYQPNLDSNLLLDEYSMFEKGQIMKWPKWCDINTWNSPLQTLSKRQEPLFRLSVERFVLLKVSSGLDWAVPDGSEAVHKLHHRGGVMWPCDPSYIHCCIHTVELKTLHVCAHVQPPVNLKSITVDAHQVYCCKCAHLTL